METKLKRELLKRYQDIVIEIENLSRHSSDIVKGSSIEFPYTTRNIVIEGETHEKIRPSLIRSERLAFLRKEAKIIEDWINSLPNFKARQIAWMYVNGDSWRDIAAKLNCESPDAARMYLNRFLNK